MTKMNEPTNVLFLENVGTITRNAFVIPFNLEC
jgi:hypothetical protein